MPFPFIDLVLDSERKPLLQFLLLAYRCYSLLQLPNNSVKKPHFIRYFFVFLSNLWCNYYKNTANLYIFMSVSLGKIINLQTVKMSRPNVSSFGYILFITALHSIQYSVIKCVPLVSIEVIFYYHRFAPYTVFHLYQLYINHLFTGFARYSVHVLQWSCICIT